MRVVGWCGVLAYFGVYVFLFLVLMSVYQEVGGEREGGGKVRIRGGKKQYTSERPLCHDFSTSAKVVGAAEVEMARKERKRARKMRR
jgi:hypothetical protein